MEWKHEKKKEKRKFFVVTNWKKYNQPENGFHFGRAFASWIR